MLQSHDQAAQKSNFKPSDQVPFFIYPVITVVDQNLDHSAIQAFRYGKYTIYG